MAKFSVYFIFCVIFFIALFNKNVLTIDIILWSKAWQKFCVQRSVTEKQRLILMRECDPKLTKERKILMSSCINGGNQIMLETKPKLCHIPNNWELTDMETFFGCMRSNVTAVYAKTPLNREKEYDFDLCATKVLSVNGWENMCLSSAVIGFRKKMKVCSDTHPMIKRAIKSCVAQDSLLAAKINNVLPIPCQYLNYRPKLQTCIDGYESELKSNDEQWSKYQLRKKSYSDCLRKIALESQSIG